MTATPSIDLPGWMAEQLSQASPDLLRQMVQTFAEALMSADADAVCGAGYGQRSPERSNTRNGYRQRDWDTRAGTIELAIPKLREGSYFPDWLLERRRRAESALVSVVATSYLLGVSHPADGEAGRAARHHPAVEVAGRRRWPRPRRAGRGVPHPAVGRRPVHVRRRRRAGAQGPRGRPHGQRARPARDRGQRRRLPGDPRPARHLRRGRRRLAGVLPRPDRPRPDRRRLGHLRRAPRPGRGDRRHPARRRLAAVPHPLRGEPDVGHPEDRRGAG